VSVIQLHSFVFDCFRPTLFSCNNHSNTLKAKIEDRVENFYQLPITETA